LTTNTATERDCRSPPRTIERAHSDAPLERAAKIARTLTRSTLAIARRRRGHPLGTVRALRDGHDEPTAWLPPLLEQSFLRSSRSRNLRKVPFDVTGLTVRKFHSKLFNGRSIWPTELGNWPFHIRRFDVPMPRSRQDRLRIPNQLRYANDDGM
jgi:hypothetical protein